MFTTESVVANSWARAILRGDRKIEEIPNLSNLIIIVSKIIEGVEINV